MQIHLAGDPPYGTAWGDARGNFYTDFDAYPTSYFDGTLRRRGAYSYSTYLGDYNARRAVPTDVTLQLAGTPVSGQTYQITATVCLEAGGTPKTIRLYIVQVLDYWPTAVSYSRNGMKLPAYTHGSEPILSLTPGNCHVVNVNMTFDATSWANQDDMRIIAWAQENQTTSPPTDRAEVHQAAIMYWPFIVDCNGNGIPDDQDILNCLPGELWCADCNANGIPDGCEDDCNNNDIPDDCDIAAGTSQDCNSNVIPDECELATKDCNSNGIPDDCDIPAGTSQDCNTNWIPDECELATNDCNSNLIPDDCDIAAGTSPDCNYNGVPDECELTGNDCNANLVPDECDIAGPTSDDCNNNGTPDECELAEHDCNANLVPDDCDIAAGTSLDCNHNDIPDECDIAAGTSQDCQPNGIPDECDLLAEFTDESPEYTPLGTGNPQTHNLYGPPLASSDVTLTFSGFGDLNFSSEYVTVQLNSTTIGTVFNTGGEADCPGGPNIQALVVPAAQWNAAAGTGTVTILMTASSSVNPSQCNPLSSWISVDAAYETAVEGLDCNTNNVPDVCELEGNDCNTNGVLDECDIAAGTSQDANSNGIPDECEQPNDGACCYPNGSCAVTPEAGCTGIWQGAGTVCDPNPCPQWCLGDMDCSGGAPTFDDIKYFSAAIGSESSWWDYYRSRNGGADPPCYWLMGDYNTPQDGVEFSDIKPFAASIGQPCILFGG